MRILCVIPARGGSKRLPGKNIRKLGAKPLINWTIDAAQGVAGIVDILVSTDDEEIAETARQAGALVPWLRPQVLATDTASSVDVARHALDWYVDSKGAVDGVLLLQPTSPFRRRETIERGIALFSANSAATVVGVSPVKTHPLWAFKLNGQHLESFVDVGGLGVRSQDLPPAFAVNGLFYLVSPETLTREKTFFPADALPLVINDPIEAIDIDDDFDWLVANACLDRVLENS